MADDDSMGLGAVSVDGDAVEFQRAKAKAFARLFEEPAESLRAGRFTLLEPIGSGGMGSVYAAYDPELDRKVALKFLRSDVPGGPQRLRAEARAMARLSHPNVLTVYEVGEYRGQLFVAMELADGQTLRDYVTRYQSAWKRIVAVYVEAGRGLVAAHAAGIVHRDFKPENVLVDRDGRARVTDFGLAQTTTDETSGGGGTPAYMAPEQREGGAVDARSDQYSFCVSLWESLYGERPDPGERPTRAPDPRVPNAVHRALLRGLARDPDERYPELSRLVGDLAKRLRPRFRWKIAALAALGGSAVFGGAYPFEEAAGSPCDDREDPFDGIWDATRRARIEGTFSQSGAPYAADAWSSSAGAVDQYVARWKTVRREACRATVELGEQSESMMDRRMACLDRRRASVDALAEVWESGDSAVVETAVSSAAALPGLAACSDRRRLESSRPIVDDDRMSEQIATIEAEIERAAASWHAGKYARASEIAGAVLDDAKTLGFAPVEARVHFELGRAFASLAEVDQAEQHFQRAIEVGGPAAATETTAAATVGWLGVVGDLAARRDEARGLDKAADVALAVAGDPASVRARLLRTRSRVAYHGSDFPAAATFAKAAVSHTETVFGPEDVRTADALETLAAAQQAAGDLAFAASVTERVLEIRRARLGDWHPSVATSLTVLGGSQLALGRYEDAEASLRRAIEVGEKALGPDHPNLARAVVNLGNALLERSAYDEARAAFTRGVALLEAKLGPDHLHVAATLNNLGASEFELGRLDEAREAYERSLAILERTMGSDHLNVAITLSNIAGIARDQGDLREAEARLGRSIEIRTARLGPDHPQLARAWFDLALVKRDGGRFGEAKVLLQRTLAAQKAKLGDDHVSVGHTLRELGTLALARGQTKAAVSQLEHALEIGTASDDGPVERSRTRLALARALAATGQTDRSRAMAETALTELGGKSERLEAEITQWLAGDESPG